METDPLTQDCKLEKIYGVQTWNAPNTHHIVQYSRDFSHIYCALQILSKAIRVLSWRNNCNFEFICCTIQI